jgi:hypothetical protein
MFYLADRHPKEGVISYGMKTILGLAVLASNRPHLLYLIMYACRRSSGSLDTFVRHLAELKREGWELPLDDLREFFLSILLEHSTARHAYEVSCILTALRELRIPVNSDWLEEVARMPSSVCALLSLNLQTEGLIVGALDQDFRMHEADADGLKNEMWMLSYEATRQNMWSKAVSPDYISGHQYFGALLKLNVGFFKGSASVRPVKRSVGVAPRDPY